MTYIYLCNLMISYLSLIVCSIGTKSICEAKQEKTESEYSSGGWGERKCERGREHERRRECERT